MATTTQRDLTEVENDPEYKDLIVRQMSDLTKFFARQAAERVRLAATIQRRMR